MASLAAVAVAAGLVGTSLSAGQKPTAPARIGPARGSRAEAQAYVRHLMAELSLPEGTKPAHLQSLPELMRERQPDAPGWAGASRILIVPGQPLAVLRRISGHAPFNQPVIYSVAPVEGVTILQAPKPGIDAVVLDLAVEADSRATTLVGAYAFAAWLPYPSAAERLDAASFRAVTIVSDQPFAKPRTAPRIITAPAVITRIATFLNGRSPAPQSTVAGLSCAPGVSYTLRFIPRKKHAPAVTVSTFCVTVAITVNGKLQPLLWDTDGGLDKIASELLMR